MDQRQKQLESWLQSQFGQVISLKAVQGDASFRRYFRFQLAGQAYVAMDSPPALEDCRPFVRLSQTFLEHNVPVPKVFAADQEQGFVCLEDFGDGLFYDLLNEETADELYGLAIEALPNIQSLQALPLFARPQLAQELVFFSEWFVHALLALRLNEAQQNCLQQTYELLLRNAEQQPQVAIHRDYHSRNLMRLPSGELGVLDFQDAAMGPITYDLVSLIRDCYVDWPESKVQQWLADCYQLLQASEGLAAEVSLTEFQRWFDLTGMQRHLKAIFIFARKQLRDDCDFYLQFIPRTLNYVQRVAAKYPELTEFQSLLAEVILPAWQRCSTS